MLEGLNEVLGVGWLYWHGLMAGPYAAWVGLVLLVVCVLAITSAIDDLTTERASYAVRLCAAVGVVLSVGITIMLAFVVLERLL